MSPAIGSDIAAAVALAGPAADWQNNPDGAPGQQEDHQHDAERHLADAQPGSRSPSRANLVFVLAVRVRIVIGVGVVVGVRICIRSDIVVDVVIHVGIGVRVYIGVRVDIRIGIKVVVGAEIALAERHAAYRVQTQIQQGQPKGSRKMRFHQLASH